ncbi:MAG TPA: lineage-specific thermal regulator protein [Bacillus bacterium]|uniref:PadR family transcriptional regulator n=1 Tax=Siminovitchia fordii TaxID=254759 RepID=UPI00037AE939|nr:PadR family transcriptional regulator [Siminovitchia fordii]HBZ11186.1 lineage-specific thermal regulator protein [Bacillus sp. (in: firmicutes)]
MEERLRRLGKKKLSNELMFTEQHRKNIYQAIDREQKSNEEILIATLQLLNEKRTGFELLQMLESRNIKKFINQEGALYLLLHELEQKEWIASLWMDNHLKYYYLQDKGRKVLMKAEEKQQRHSPALKDLLGGDILYE